MKKCPEKKWMYVVADCDLSKEFENEFNSVEDAMAKLCKRGFLAVEVRGVICQLQDCKELSSNELSSSSSPLFCKLELN